MSEKDTCSFCKKQANSWVSFVSTEVQATICPNCLMWGADSRIDIIRRGLKLDKAARNRAGIKVEKGSAYDGQ